MKLIKLNNNLDQICQKAKEVILSGGVAILPFDTVYGMVCDCRNEKALKKIYELKKRDLSLTIGLACDSIDSLLAISSPGDFAASYLADKVPGQFTFILPINDQSISPLCTKNGTVGIRIPSFLLIQEVARTCGGAIAQTSANVSGQPFCISFKEVKKQFGLLINDVDLVVDGGLLANGMPSKLIDLTGIEPIEIARK
jgi:tRNA threonylcarbamoyl adenosine modification protein (Sua5/YciO/YrdC/YwlC family)